MLVRKIICQKVNVSGPLLGIDPLWFDSRKRPPPVSDRDLGSLGGCLRKVGRYTFQASLDQHFKKHFSVSNLPLQSAFVRVQLTMPGR